jgi:hypothetical protein
MRKMLIKTCLSFILVVIIAFEISAQCEGDFVIDGDVDGEDVAVFARLLSLVDPEDPDAIDAADLADFAADFGRTNCPLPPPAPLNLFNIGNSIGEGIAAYEDIGVAHHETVWSTGYDPVDSVYSLNERFEFIDTVGYDENNDERELDGIFNHAIEGDEMEDFATQAGAVVTTAGEETPPLTVGMVTVFLGNNDVCTDAVGTMTDLETFESQYRDGLEALKNSTVTKNAYIHVSGIPAIYWLWIAKRDRLWCLIVWSQVPCKELLENPGVNDCVTDIYDPDTIDYDPDEGDGPNCIRRKEFHAAIRDDYNRIIRDVLMEYKITGRLPNAYYIDIFDIQFEAIHVNGGDFLVGDCFHPSVEGHEVLAREQWCRSPWSIGDPSCAP